jgi:DNA invertase Pin-like site-specific DNA recombinase
LLKEFVEVESGKKDVNRPMLHGALEACKRTGARLLIAKLDRLSRNVAFIANLMESGVEFVAVDFPQANRLTVHILSAMAEYEREMISKRTKAALKAAKAKGVKLGSPKGLTEEAAREGRVKSRSVRMKQADDYASRMYAVIRAYQAQGMSLQAIARRLKEDRELTPRGKESWTATTVRNVIERMERQNSGS